MIKSEAGSIQRFVIISLGTPVKAPVAIGFTKRHGREIQE